MTDTRLSPDEFKRIYKAKGWTGLTLAARWNITPQWLSRLGKNTAREIIWDDAVRGLEDLKGSKN
ncbi:hypothetical protein ACFQDN_21575 [Pseudomonas asuensis]|uniref:XRE family transcriptional regulator n=1 Tax=Pseudomonas asuensis TaxID=1825787 RepID=A0ABQ2H1F3_9PSED|nr:hypothetical protein [Pseudomonas asuensis]GGM26235.1 hypothetical protein GCM10009425_41160 [Pseudomonas asuensis]